MHSKEAERTELHKIIGRIANDLRGNVGSRDFRGDVRGMLFYRVISEIDAIVVDLEGERV